MKPNINLLKILQYYMASFNQTLINTLSSRYDVNLVSTSYLGVDPGDIVVVSYPRKDRANRRGKNLTRLGIIMSSSRSNGGVRLSSKLNTLLNFVDVEGISDEEFLGIIDRLYTKDLKPIVSEFEYAVNGSVGDFKTFNVLEISGTGVFKLNLQKKIID